MTKIYELCCVYKIINSIDNLVYIGSTGKTLYKRIEEHRLNAKNEFLKNRKIYTHMNLHGIDNFKILMIEEYKNIDRNELREYENSYIKKFDSVKNGLNAKYEVGSRCSHNKKRYVCVDCKGSDLCPHNKCKSFCVPCKGSQICEHEKHKGGCSMCNHYTCDYCNKSYGAKYNLKNHLIICFKNPINMIQCLL